MVSVRDAVIASWTSVASEVALRQNDFSGRDKETRVFRFLAESVHKTGGTIRTMGPDSQARFGSWNIDLVFFGDVRVAVEGKYKVLSDGAVPDNRMAAFFDLYKLEHYVASGDYSIGLFLWLTDELKYLAPATVIPPISRPTRGGCTDPVCS
jgi:hypothetical protein